MRIQVAFEAYASAKLPGQRKFHDVRLPCTTWVEVADAPAEPAVLRMTRRAERSLEFRRHGDGLIRPFEMAHGSPAKKAGPVMQSARLAEIALTGSGPFNPFIVGIGLRSWSGNGPDYWERRPLLDADQASFAAIERSDEDACRALVARNAAGLLCVDGEIWRKSAEPLYEVGHLTAEDYQAGRMTAWAAIDDVGSTIKEIGRHYRVDDLIDVLSAVLPGGEWDADAPATYSDRFQNIVEVLDPSVLRHAYDQLPAMVRSLRGTVQSVGRELAALPSPAIVEWTRVRDLLLDSPSGRDLAEGASRLADALAAAGAAETAGSIRAAVDLWRLSPVAEPELPASGPIPCS